jgi:murein DD-endopeptidase MepM/ murein hydrolase activator NlpD
MAISSPLTPKTSEKTIKNLKGIILNKTKVSRETFRNKTILQDRRIENDRRALQEDALEAPDIVRNPGGAAQLIAGSAKGFFERLMGFLGYLTAGWLLSNLPTWIGMGKEFIARTVKMGNLIGGFLFNTTKIFSNITSLLGATLTNIITFDFFDTSGRVGTAFEELQLSVDNWGTGFEDALKLITTPLTEGVASGEDTPPPGTQYTDEGAYETPSSGGSTTTYSSTGGQKLTDPGGKDYGEYTPGVRGSRGSARVHGAGGRTRGHTGEDYAMPTGTPLTMIAPGTVVAAVKGDRYNGGYGEFVVVQLDDGRYVKLAHLDSINVKKGDKVGAGTGPNGTAKVVGHSGSTGLGSGPHLHLDVAKSYDSNSYMVSGTMDPKSFIGGGGLVKGGNVKATGQVTQSASQPQQNLMGTSSSSSSSGGGTVSPQTVFSYIKQKGVPENHALGIVAGIDGESSFQVGVQEKGNSKQGVGLFQYTDPSRKGPFLKTVPDYKNNWKGQVDYAIDKDPNTGIYLSRQFSTPEAAAEWWLVNWERPRKDLRDGRRTKYKSFIKSFKPGAAQSGESQIASQSPAPAQLASQTQSQSQISQSSQALTPERTGPTVIVAQNPSSMGQRMMSYGGGGSSGGGSPQISEFAMLNNFIRNKLLLDLAYL